MTYATLPALATEVLSWLPPMTTIDKYAIAERLYLAGITKYKGTMTAAQQRAFFGRYIFGKKCMVIDNDMG